MSVISFFWSDENFKNFLSLFVGFGNIFSVSVGNEGGEKDFLLPVFHTFISCVLSVSQVLFSDLYNPYAVKMWCI